MKLEVPLKADRLAQIALVVLVGLLVISILGLFLPFLDPRSSVGPRLEAPSLQYWFGTDNLGRSLLPRVVEGIRTTFLISLAAVLASTVLATLIGMTSAVLGGIVDQIVVRAADAFFAFPAVLLAILIATIIGAGPTAAAVAIVIITLPLMVRVVRGAALTVTDRDFITSSYVGGASTTRLVLRHIVPNVAGVVVVQATYAASVAMLTEGAMSFLGFGVLPPSASLGSLVQEGSVYLTVAPWLALIPGIVLALAILSVNLVGDGLRDHLDPRSERALA